MTKEQIKKTWYVEIVAFCLVIVWGINTPIMKIGIADSTPLLFNSLRLVLAAIISLIILFLTKSYRKMPYKDIKKVASISCFGLFLNQAFFVFGLPETTAGNAALVLAMLPVSVALINRVLKIEVITRRVTMGIVLSLTGIIIIVVGAEKELSMSGPHILGAASILAAQFCYGYYTVYFSQLVEEYSIYQISAVVMSIGAVLFSLLAFPELVNNDWQRLPASVWYCIVFSSAFPLTVGNLVWFWVVGILGSTRSAMFHNLCPIFAISFAWVALDETFGFIQVIGAAVIFLGLYFTRKQKTGTLHYGSTLIKTET